MGSASLSIRDVARVSLPDRGSRGLLVMLELYYDDSGTHPRSDVIVWGGVGGHVDYINELHSAWQERLKEPCEGKPPIGKFSSYDLLHATGEFEGYKQGEKDLTRKNFRDVIANAGLSAVAYGISAKDWHDLIPEALRGPFSSPEYAILALAIRYGCEVAMKEEMPVQFVLDAGVARRVSVADAFLSAIDLSGINPDLAGFTLAPVKGNAALQAADLVAHETYQLFCNFRVTGQENANAHLNSLRNEAYDFRVGWLGRKQIAAMISELERTIANHEKAEEHGSGAKA